MNNPFEKLPKIDANKREKLLEFASVLRDVNASVNLISRKDMEDVEYRHVAFCAAISEFLEPSKGAKIADVGTGGGLPGIVMAILYENARVYMFDSVGKKIAAVNEMIKALNLKNAEAINSRIETFRGGFDYITGRSVCALPQFFGFVKNSISSGKKGNLANGVIYFKGGDLEPELSVPSAELNLETLFNDPRFEGKRLVHFDKISVLNSARRSGF